MDEQVENFLDEFLERYEEIHNARMEDEPEHDPEEELISPDEVLEIYDNVLEEFCHNLSAEDALKIISDNGFNEAVDEYLQEHHNRLQDFFGGRHMNAIVRRIIEKKASEIHNDELDMFIIKSGY
ncbi:hypothetical protein EBS02_10955 [bacterium]|nr:hypothetical protein [bacterium]